MANLQTKRIKTITGFHQLRGLPKPEHPLISIVDYSSIKRSADISEVNWVLDFYMISVKKGLQAKIKYGQQEYDFDEGVMFFMAPNQVFRIEVEPVQTSKRSGWMLLIHPDFLWNSALAKHIGQFEFFDYAVNEALFLSDKEEKTLNGVLQHIKEEYHSNIDRFSQNIIVSHLEVLLNYSERYYNRQFITRKIANHTILTRMEAVLNDWFGKEDLLTKGLPTVQDLSAALNVSPKYLSSLLKVLTGQTAQQHIHDKLIGKAKEKLSTTDLSVSEIAYELGFEHPQSFSKFFKLKTKLSPQEFRKSFHSN
ncbi:helix-turn-helix domain-containing protein [Pseudobacter ginsenosidimutans]|uniref:AraC family transcriptional regulator n=1 Tax=Pseudobacter ginsenosidimutans TaxID=661488 RepID=A0A4Q7N0T9_9BACT|nr:AraC family transcriptional regulator [Pseudobacter ginsenosidimutans]QEC43791.1 helix-turn-helix domain-containing protein [Pseudobacter ginsenosidimutans]RZS75210.1 AraC family transcriptional regulator [Pseudobacter ginsenosidimutans]